MSANEKQVGGGHYGSNIQHWDYVVANDLDYFQAQITKYVTRWKKKNGLQDLLKAQHFLEKYIELETKKDAEEYKRTVSPVNPIHPNLPYIVTCSTVDGSQPQSQGYVNQDK